MPDLVSCKVLKAFGMWFPGMIAGFSPADIPGFVAAGLIEPIDQAPAEAAPAAEEGDESPSADIPADWTEMHHLKLIPLAKKIAGPDVPENATKEWAIGVIQAELARRAETKE